MSDLPNIAIGLVTFKRTEMALRTVQSTIDNLGYPKEKRGWYVADDGSPVKHVASILSKLEMAGENIIGYHNEHMRRKGDENSYHAGLGWNRCLGLCHQYSDFVLWLEDDWDLDQPLDLVPYVKLLQERVDVGIVSFRILSTGADVHTIGHEGRVYLRYDRTTQYAFSGNPYLRHARYTKFYGTFAEDRNPGLMELHQDDQYRFGERTQPRSGDDGPQIWRPADISIWGSWKHVGSVKTWE